MLEASVSKPLLVNGGCGSPSEVTRPVSIKASCTLKQILAREAWYIGYNCFFYIEKFPLLFSHKVIIL